MSTIKSSTEHLTLNADGSGKDIKFQANGVEKASISSAGAFTSTSIDATKLSGALPAIDGGALTNLPVQMTDTGWVSLTPYLTNGWVAVNASAYPLQYRKIGDTVVFRGLVNSGTNQKIFHALPTAIRPTYHTHLTRGGASDTAGASNNDAASWVSTAGEMGTGISSVGLSWQSIDIVYLTN